MRKCVCMIVNIRDRWIFCRVSKISTYLLVLNHGWNNLDIILKFSATKLSYILSTYPSVKHEGILITFSSNHKHLTGNKCYPSSIFEQQIASRYFNKLSHSHRVILQTRFHAVWLICTLKARVKWEGIYFRMEYYLNLKFILTDLTFHG